LEDALDSVPSTSHAVEASAASLFNRELSWLDLNKRVLELAADPNEPLLERVKFCGILSANLDEFFMVRVAGLLDQVVSGLAVRSPDGRTPQQTLAEIRARALDLSAEQSRLWRDELCPALAANGIVLGTVEDATRRSGMSSNRSSNARSTPS
jgi:polyphosphate kinase